MALRQVRIPQKSEQTQDAQIGRIQNYLFAAANQLNQIVFIPGVASEALTFTPGETKVINHGLTRVPVGFLVIDAQTGPALVYRGATNDATISVTSTGAGTFRFWFY